MLHKASFLVWLGAFGIHVLVYALRVPGLVAADWGRDSGTSGAALRIGTVALALLAGLTVALAALPAAGPCCTGREATTEERTNSTSRSPCASISARISGGPPFALAANAEAKQGALGCR